MSCDPMTQQGRVRAVFGANTSLWGGGWRRWAFPGIWLIYLAQVVGGVAKHASGAVEIAGYAIIGVFAIIYLAAIPAGWENAHKTFWSLYVVTLLLTGVELLIAHEDAFVFCVYVTVLTVASRARWGVAMVGAMALASAVVPAVVPGWNADSGFGTAVSIVLVGMAMFGFFAIIRSNIELAAARAEVARLAAENERTRIARDLHDLLGHSLTTITVKAGLARRLAERAEFERAAKEIAEVETLSRSTLSDVRAAVAGHRDVTLAGELATSREVLRAAGVIAELPASVADVPAELSELFGWVLREAVTNVVRHAHAAHCIVTLGPNWIEVRDDGRGGTVGAGNGLTGLRERVAADGGTVEVSGTNRGWTVRVDVPLPLPGATGAAETPAISTT
ncbi:sensor histidine kinase [Jatrophihabitans cynanchi]|jgi:two-component system sensor histidine kinase DesK|uniref:Sensor histidine kinase n=1 Tax=Jatrophihabitans cynanchi TaxID=2944128 RepID=A0ABY7JSV5_9ACTN|nr:sensor histidine kinase [Jatrophihabitans sp. SB3-54]WAX55644.1 sensor histidine kinase [Jatrophihabitans sp. SB3-54]